MADSQAEARWHKPWRTRLTDARSWLGLCLCLAACSPSPPADSTGFAGYDLRSEADQAIAFDYNGDGDEDMFLYRPGSGAACVARSNGNGSFSATYAQGPGGAGIAGFDLQSRADRVFPFDYDGDGKQDLFLYRPGGGAVVVARSKGDGTFAAAYAQGAGGAGIAGFDLRSTDDRALPFDYNGDGKQDLFLYRPGAGAAVVAESKGDGTFTAAYAQREDGAGIAGFDLRSPEDRALAFDYDGDGRRELLLYRPGFGAAAVVRWHPEGGFTAVYAQAAGGRGIGGFDLSSTKDQALAFDYNGDGKQDLFLYRPGSGAAWVARSNGDGTFTAVHTQGGRGAGIARFDMKSPDDRALAFDYDGDGKQDLFLYRPGSGAAWVAKSNGDGTFTAAYAQGGHGSGIGGFDMKSTTDRVLVFDYDGDKKQDLFLYRRETGAAWVVRSNGDGTFTQGHP